MAKARRHALRVDANQARVVAALRAIGAEVWSIGDPGDLLVGYGGRLSIVEVKDGDKPPSQRRLTKRELATQARCEAAGLPYYVVLSPEDALRQIAGVDIFGG
jgi:hypothetical protein